MRATYCCGKCGTPRLPRENCRPCANARNAAYKKRLREAGKKPKRPSRAFDPATKEQMAMRGSVARQAISAENVRRLKREYKQRNRHKAVADCAARFASKLRARPSWADRRLIDDLYALARVYRDHGFDAHVDHIVPLRSKLVCGLHCEANLRVVPASENLSKNNRWWPDMP